MGRRCCYAGSRGTTGWWRLAGGGRAEGAHEGKEGDDSRERRGMEIHYFFFFLKWLEGRFIRSPERLVLEQSNFTERAVIDLNCFQNK